MKSQIKIVKRKPDLTPTDSQAESVTKSVELSTREITIVVKKWIAELRERKRVTTVIGNQASWGEKGAPLHWTLEDGNNLHRLEPLLTKPFVTVDQVDQARTSENHPRPDFQTIRGAPPGCAGSIKSLERNIQTCYSKASSQQGTAQLQTFQSLCLRIGSLTMSLANEIWGSSMSDMLQLVVTWPSANWMVSVVLFHTRQAKELLAKSRRP